jgi:hypothetical protein
MDILILLSLFAIKHWVVDFVWQTQEEIKHKGTYLDYRGMTHSIKHGVITFVIMKVAGLEFSEAAIIGALDFLVHYHIDWAKMQLSKGLTPVDHTFWVWLGLDQLLHTLTYFGIVAILLII